MIKTGVYRVNLLKKINVPNYIEMLGRKALVYYRGMEEECKRCGQKDHKVKECRVKLCHRCKSRHHLIKDCNACSKCQKEHEGEICPVISFAEMVKCRPRTISEIREKKKEKERKERNEKEKSRKNEEEGNSVGSVKSVIDGFESLNKETNIEEIRGRQKSTKERSEEEGSEEKIEVQLSKEMKIKRKRVREEVDKSVNKVKAGKTQRNRR
ncbi:uncharacterized protein [Centruroides vittatus]|uniref:uncharacterized protein n=1 Tax=Centruroides vittatus TaxID=120091 RepID=UPI00350EEEDD